MEPKNEIVHEKVSKILSVRRRELASRSVESFARVYLQQYFKQAASRMHREIFEMLDPRCFTKRKMLAIAAPRGHAKSTLISVAYVLYCICLGTERFIYLISSTMEQAEDHLRNIKKELSDNSLLLEDFPDVCDVPGSRPGPPRWTRRELITRNDVRITASSPESKLRGRRHKSHRPGLVICDDLETDSGVASEVLRRTLQEWFYKAVMNCGTSDTKYIVIGTVLHYDSLLAKLIDPIKSSGWTGRKYKAVEVWDDHPELWEKWATIHNYQDEFEGQSGAEAAKRFFEKNRTAMLEASQVLWPEREDYYALRELRLTAGQASFDSEKQNEPIDSTSCLFPEHLFHFWDDKFETEQELLAYLGDNATTFGACDPSMGKHGKTRDDTAIVTLIRDNRTNLLYVVDADIGRYAPDAIIDRLIEYQARRSYSAFGMETIQFQEFLSQELCKRSRIKGHEIPILKLNPVIDKIGRIQSLQPKVTSGTILFSRRHRTLLDQLRHFPKAAHDDGPDALQMAVQLATETKRRPGILWARKEPLYPGCKTGFLVLDDADEQEPAYIRRGREFLRS